MTSTLRLTVSSLFWFFIHYNRFCNSAIRLPTPSAQNSDLESSLPPFDSFSRLSFQCLRALISGSPDSHLRVYGLSSRGLWTLISGSPDSYLKVSGLSSPWPRTLISGSLDSHLGSSGLYCWRLRTLISGSPYSGSPNSHLGVSGVTGAEGEAVGCFCPRWTSSATNGAQRLGRGPSDRRLSAPGQPGTNNMMTRATAVHETS